MIRSLIAGVSAIAVVGAPAASASADTPIIAQAGVRITTDGYSWCTLGAVGTDVHGNKVALTAGHCDDAAVAYLCVNQDGNSIASLADQRCGLGPRLGIYESTGGVTDGLTDWSFMRLDDDVTELPNSVHGLTINHIDTAPRLFQYMAKDGQRTGLTHGWVTYVGADGIWDGTTIAYYGDSGSPGVIDGGLAGLTKTFGFLHGHPGFDEFVPMSAIMVQVDAQGGVGAGFTVAQ